MTLSNLNFKKILGIFHKGKKVEFRTISTKAHHDWKIMFSVFVVVSILIVVFNTLLFFKVNGGQLLSFSEPKKTENSSLNQKKLEETVRFFEEREDHFLELKTVRSSVVDPSL